MRTVSRRFFPLQRCVRMELNHQKAKDGPDNDGVPTEELKRLHCNRIKCGDCERVSECDDGYAREHIPELSSEVASSTIKRLGLRGDVRYKSAS